MTTLEAHCMDVTCNRCGIVYEFDEALISPTGTTVKCTQCGHLFKVHRSATAKALGSHGDSPTELPRWRVRRVDGSIHTLESLAELTHLISAGQFAADDEISRTGQVWKRLGDVAELAPLFERAPRQRRLSEAPLPPPPEPQLDSEAPAAGAKRRRRATSEPLFHEPSPGSAEPVQEAPRAEAHDEVTPEALVTASHLPLPLSPSVASTPSVSFAASEARAVPVAPADIDMATPAAADERSPSRRAGRNGARTAMFVVGAALLLVAGVGAGLFLRARGGSGTAPAVRPAASAQNPVRRGDEALASHRIERFEEAIAAYTEALALHPDDPHLLSSLSRVYAVWSDWLQFRLRALRASGQGSKAQADQLRAQTRGLIEQAKHYGERAAQRNPGNEEASVALSDALRLSGNLVAARAEIDRARATQGTDSAETLRVAAMLAIDEADSEMRAGRSLAKRAVAADPSLIRTRLLLARCLLFDDDAAGAEAQLAAVRQLDPKHPLLAEVAAAIAVGRHKTSGPGPTRPRAEDAGLSARTEVPSARENTSPPAQRPASNSGSSDPLELVRRGEAALERGAVPVAERAFERALELDPRSARAMTGLGYVALEQNQPIAAISQFRRAAAREHSEALIGLGEAYRKLGRTRDALEAYRSYLRRYPKGERRSIAQRQSELLAEQLEKAR